MGVVCNATDATQHGWSYDAVAKQIKHGGLCLSTVGWDVPLNLDACSKSGSYQNFSFDTSTGLFHINAPAADKKLYPACLQVGAGAISKADVYKCNAANPAMLFDVDADDGLIRSRAQWPSLKGYECLAARDHYAPPPSPETNTTISISVDGQGLVFDAKPETLKGTSYGWGAIPLLSVYDKGTGLPVLPWHE